MRQVGNDSLSNSETAVTSSLLRYVDFQFSEATSPLFRRELMDRPWVHLLLVEFYHDFQYANCPFDFTTYDFTFSDKGNPDYCAGKTSEAYIENEVIALKSCYDPLNITSAAPYYGPFSCLGSWPADQKDTPSFGDFIVIEMYDEAKWPYCGRYKVDTNGVITISIYLSMSQGDWFPVMCIASVDNEFMYDDGNQKFVRMVFTPPYTSTIEQTTQADSTIVTTESAITTSIEPTTTELSTTEPTTTEPTTTEPTTTELKTTEPTTIELTTTEPTTTEPTPITTIVPTTNEPTITELTTTEQTTKETTTTVPTTSTTDPTTSTTDPTSTTTDPTTTTTTAPTITTTTVPTTSTTVPTTSTTVPTTSTTDPTTSSTDPTTSTTDLIIAAVGSTNTSNNMMASKSSKSEIWNSIRDLYWPWWILVGVSILLLALLTCCLIYAAKRRKRGVDDHEKGKQMSDKSQANLQQTSKNSGTSLNKDAAKAPQRARKITVKPFVPPKKWNF
ncbi:Hypothetical predicted protein [Mytilus galloprovincialis]|uniref:Uncharacterized protein n=1 Tax=Mytilus galloprovincialis TaxID=29158 RepID=A0A8B6CVP2_MYTGA|nr:Hypothetical predicted protein [Mytilus galloprovincialis]